MLKNLVTLGSGELAARGLHAIAFVLLARALGQEALGQFGLAVAVTSYALLLVTQGFDPIAIRDVAGDRAELRHHVEQILGLRLVLALVAAAATCGYVLLARPDHTTGRLLLVLSVSYAANAFTPRWSFLAIEKTRPLVVAGFLSQICFLTAALLIQSPSQVVWAAVAQVLGESVAAVFLLRTLAVVCGGRFTLRVDRAFAERLIRRSWPLTVSLLLGNMIYNFDVVMLWAMGRSEEIGGYLACYRCITVFTPLLAAFQTTALPWLSRSYPDYAGIRRRVTHLALGAAVILGLAGLAIGSFSRDVLSLLFGPGYAGTADILRVLVWILPLQGARTLMRQVLIAFHLPKADTRNLLFGVITNVLLDFALIPRLGALGCAISTVASETVFSVCSGLTVRLRVSRG